MITVESVKKYLAKMYGNESYEKLEDPEKEKIIFAAHELLKDNFKPSKITNRAVSLQVLYMLEGEEEDLDRLKRQGVKSYAVKGVSVSFDSSFIAPAVIKILEPAGGAKAKELI